MELRHLRYFLAVAEENSFTAAAARLHLAQPALSQQIGALERELGVTLIERGARTRGLTEAGTRFAVRVRRILLEAEAASDEMAAFGGGTRGLVRFGSALQSLTEARVAGVLADFKRKNPGLTIGFREGLSEPLLDLLTHGKLDLALIHLGHGDGAPLVRVGFEELSVEIEKLYEEPLYLAVGPRHRLAKRQSVRWKEIADEDFVSFSAGSTIRELVAGVSRESGVPMRPPVAEASLGSIRALVSAGVGVTVLPRIALTLPGPPLHGVRLTSPSLTRTVALARNAVRYESPATRTFTAFLRDALRKPARRARRPSTAGSEALRR